MAEGHHSEPRNPWSLERAILAQEGEEAGKRVDDGAVALGERNVWLMRREYPEVALISHDQVFIDRKSSDLPFFL